MLMKAEGLSKAFDDVVVLNNVSLEIKPGEVVSLVGRSGAGKTTILRLIAGLERCDQGTIVVDDNYLCRQDGSKMIYASKKELFDIRRSLGLVFQNYHLFPHMTVLENVTLALTEVYKKPKKEALKIATEMLNSLDLGEKLANKPFELSGGQKQRVAIARSCVTNPKLLCFDEPTAALDSGLVLGVIEIIRDLAKKGMGVMVISHDEKFVRDVSDRILSMESGRIKAEYQPDEYAKLIRE